MYRYRSYFITPKSRIRIYRQRKSGWLLLVYFLLIFISSVFLWLYSDCWISHWLNLYWNGIQSQKINDEFLYLWVEPIFISLIVTGILTIVLLIVIDFIWELLRGFDWIILMIKRLFKSLNKINFSLLLLLSLVSIISCKRYDRMAEEFRTINAISSCKTLDPSFDDTIKAKQICELILQIKNNQSNYEDMPWKHIAKSMLIIPDSVIFNYDICKICNSKRVQLYFRSPDWTWENLCGEAGHMIICPVCKTQDFNLEIMN